MIEKADIKISGLTIFAIFSFDSLIWCHHLTHLEKRGADCAFARASISISEKP
jgi:hypothetical protein